MIQMNKTHIAAVFTPQVMVDYIKLYASYIKAKVDSVEFVNGPQFHPDQWIEFETGTEEYLASIQGNNGVPLSYLLRDNRRWWESCLQNHLYKLYGIKIYRMSQSTPVICLPVNIRKNVSYAMRVDWKKTERQPWSKYKVAGHVCLCASQFRHAYQSILMMKSAYQSWWRVYGVVEWIDCRKSGCQSDPP